MKKIKVGIIGLGVGRKHIAGFQSHPQSQVIKTCDFDNERLEDVKQEYPEIEGVCSADEVLNDPDIDVVSIASYDNYHFEQITQALNNGKHVYVEKPMCLFDYEARSIRGLLKSKPEIKLSSNLVLRTCPRFVRLKEAVQSGEMGDIYSMKAEYLWGRKHKLTDGWRKDMDFYSIIHGAAVHMIDLLIWMIDMLPVEVKAYGNQITTKDSEMKYNDFAAILMKFETGLIAEVSAHGGCVHPHFHNISIYGSNKSFINGITGGVWVNSQDPEVQPEPIKEEYPGKARRKDSITTFIDSILNKKIEPMVTDTDVFNVMSICYAAEKSITTNETTQVEYI